MVKIKIAAVGDLLMKSMIIASSEKAGTYQFEPIFAKVKPYLKKHDITIGNLETTFSGKRRSGGFRGYPTIKNPIERRNPKTGNPLFNCPDQLAPAIRRSGFTVLTTANNHCMDGGVAGLKRTLRILDQQGLKHTGTFRSPEESGKVLIVREKGVNIGILNYTMGTNSIPVPKPWLVNRIHPKKIIADIRKMKKRTDFLIVCLHFGWEYHSAPNKNQKSLMHVLFKNGVNAIIGTHPHVLHPVTVNKVKDNSGHVRMRVAASSLGNFVSTKLKGNNNTIRGMILSLTVTKSDNGITDIEKVERKPTIVRWRRVKQRTLYSVTPR